MQSVFEKMKLLLGEPQELDSKSVWQAEFEKATEAIALALVSMDPAMAFKVTILLSKMANEMNESTIFVVLHRSFLA